MCGWYAIDLIASLAFTS